MDSRPCLVCGRELWLFQGQEFQCNDGVACSTVGNYGSRVFDGALTGDIIRFCICDDCMRALGKEERLFTTREKRHVLLDPDSPWFEDEEGHKKQREVGLLGWEWLDRPYIPWNANLTGWLEEDCCYVKPEEVGKPRKNIEWYEPGVLYFQQVFKDRLDPEDKKKIVLLHEEKHKRGRT